MIDSDTRELVKSQGNIPAFGDYNGKKALVGFRDLILMVTHKNLELL
jgi:hypothetical protein